MAGPLAWLFPTSVSSRVHAALTVAVMLFAFAFNWLAANRGIYFYDVSIVYDGAWRVLQGQRPYQDFAMSHAPLAYYILAGAFQLFGVSYATFVGLASFFNMIGALATMRIAGRLAPGTEFWAGLMTAVWYQAMPGFVQVEQVAFFFNFLCFWMLVEAGASGTARANGLRALGGVCLVAAFLSKQNGGVFFIPVAAACLLLPAYASWRQRWMAAGAFVGGALVLAGAFGAYLFLAADPARFWHHVIAVPSRFGGGRIGFSLTPKVLLANFILGINAIFAVRTASRVAFVALALVAVRAYQRPEARRLLPLPVIGSLVGLLIFHYCFVSSMLNEQENGLPFLGLEVALSVGLFRWTVPLLEGVGEDLFQQRKWLVVPFLAVFGMLIYIGATVAWGRSVNQFPENATFTERVELPQARFVQWGEPSSLGGSPTDGRVSRQEFEGLVRYLEAKDQNLFVFPASTILYGFLKKPSPAPWLYFLEGHSFASEDLPRLDGETVSNLQRHNVCVWVKETASWLGEHEEYYKLPRTKAWLEGNFGLVRRFGPYEVWERSACPAK